MYSEQMMREEGFDDGPAFRLAMYTDVVWRACRIILDIRMHRGELTAEEAIDFLVEHTSFETANARAEVRRYTYTPGYQLSYLLGKVLILGLREEEKRRLGRCVRPARVPRHAAAQRLAADLVPPPAAPRRGRLSGGCHPLDRRREGAVAGRVLARRLGRHRVTHRPARADRGAVRRPGGADPPPRRLRRAPSGSRRRASRSWARSRGGSRCRSSSRAGSRRPTTCGSRSRRARRGSSSRSRSSSAPRRSRSASRSRATGWPSASTRGRSGSPPSRGGGPRHRPSTRSWASSWATASRGSS